VVFGSDQGLCGRFNEEVVAFAAERIRSLLSEREEVNLMTVGNRAAGGLARLGLRPRDGLSLPNSVTGLTALVEDLLLKIDAWRREADVGRILFYYNHPVQRTRFQPVQRQLIPVDMNRVGTLEAKDWPTRVLPTFTMEPERLLAALVREHLFIAVYRAAAESLASEHGSRLSSMQAAERNIDERLDELESEYRFRRQSAITEELLDVVAGFEALTGSEG
jgi:F-type H+-transporting ATPase subunit gamma